MKYCTHCGKELLDEAVICVGCGYAVEGNKIISKADVKIKKPKKPINVKKLVISLAIAFAVLLIAVGGFIGIRIVNNNALAANLQSQIAGKTFEFKDISEDYSVFNICWISFAEDGRYSLEATDMLYYYELETEEGDYSVNVEFDGTCELLVGALAYGVALDEDGEIEYISQMGQRYYPFATIKGDSLARFVDSERYEYEIQMHKEEALTSFYTYFKYNKVEDFEELIPVIFEEYELSVEYVEDELPYAFEYIVTISGEYYVNKMEFPNLTKEGEISCRVVMHDLGTDVTVLSGGNIISAMNLYSVLSKYSYY